MIIIDTGMVKERREKVTERRGRAVHTCLPPRVCEHEEVVQEDVEFAELLVTIDDILLHHLHFQSTYHV